MTDEPDGETAAALAPEWETAARVNFASAQNDVAVVRSLALVNGGETALESLTLRLRAEPPAIREKTWTLDRIGPGERLEIGDLAMPLDTGRLGGLDEAEIGELILTVEGPDGLLVEERRRIELLARDQWGGVGEMAQLLAAFVAPNHPAVAGLLKDASKILEAAGHDPSLEGYQAGDPGRVWMMAAAIWSAVTAKGLTYAMPPASFESRGQKIRDPGRIMGEGLGTCLDTTLLLAAAWEAAGMNPVVLFSHGHAWAGVWLHPQDFGYTTEPDVVTVRKAVQAHELVTLETTLVTKRPAPGFDEAAAAGRARLDEAREHEFVLAIDIARARAARIRPLASHLAGEAPAEQHAEIAPAALPPPLDSGALAADLAEPEPETPLGRVERWQRKLLDLSLRNRLLNFTDSRGSVPIMVPDLGALEDALAGGKSFAAHALLKDDPVGNRDLPPEEARRVEAAAAAEAYGKGQVAIRLTAREMDRRLTELYRKARSDLQEGGTNTLFLAAGFLRWRRSPNDTRHYRAPLLLLPARLGRRSATSGFRISHHEDEVSFNATLLELLKRDFELSVPELAGELPRDESGIDLPLIFETMRRRIRDVPGFEVLEETALSTFSFSKYLMWKDLVDRTDRLRESRLVRHLVDSPDKVFEGAGGPAIRPGDLDSRMDPADVLAPLPADSSQLAAVIEAREGRDFVLIGPPGTGKSQTIANIVCQCLAAGKTVLFVAEKAAALDVVHRRLAAHGLADAVLELHSNKTDRRAVLEQLGRAWDRDAGVEAGAWVEVNGDLRLSRDRLNAYVAALHTAGSQGFSIFDAVGWVAGVPEGPFLVFEDRDAHDAEGFAHLTRLAEEAGRTHGVVAERPPLDLVVSPDWSFAWEAVLIEAAAALSNAAKALGEAASALSATLSLRPDSTGRPGRRVLLGDLGVRARAGAPDLTPVPDMAAQDLQAALDEIEADCAALEAARAACVGSYAEAELLRAPLDRLDADWREAETKLWPLSGLAKRKVKKLLGTYSAGGVPDPAVDLPRLIEMRTRLEAIAANPLAGLAGPARDTARARALVEETIAFRQSVAAAEAEAEDTVTFARAITELTGAADGPVRRALAAHVAAATGFADAAGTFEAAGGWVPGDASLDDLRAGLSRLEANRRHIADWTRWVEAREAATAAGLGPLVEALAADGIEGAPGDAFRRAYARWWLPLALDASDELRRFARWDHEDAIATFRALDDRAAALAPAEVKRRIPHGLPPRDEVPRASELGTLRHQLGLKRPSMAIRRLLAEMPESFPRLSPCVLMSPLSIAQYLPAGQAMFDVVIFDEASQITTWDAIGAVARGRQAIVVGDPKQLPPTNFFGRAEGVEEELPEIERDMPSILDEVAAAGVPTRRLSWHYRSRDEALIAFSNHHYYGGGLVTFPAPAPGGQGLRFHKVDGQFARGRGRINEVEARRIAGLVRRRLTAWLELPEEARPTLGVITFNAQQQSLILDLMDAARRADPRLEWFFSDAREEPVIVKNLENIQGDERDLMFFSITYAPDTEGRFTMNFGPLNTEGGEKRLNVAITRARRELHVVSSITTDMIDLNRTRAVGVAHLKAFLDYAERGAEALPSAEVPEGGTAGRFEEAVAAALRAAGWEVHARIGISGVRVDLGVADPDRPGAYLAGIECDGEQYRAAATARDRDRVRETVLEGLGWTVLRVWSADWYRDAEAATARLVTSLEEALAARRAAPAPDQADLDALWEDEPSAPESTVEPEPEPPVEDVDTAPDPAPAIEAASYAEAPPLLQPAPDALPPDEDPQPDPERFFEEDYAPQLSALISTILTRDGPTPIARLSRLIAQRHGWQRTGRRISARIEAVIPDAHCAEENGTVFVWPGPPTDRTPWQGLGDRAIRDVSRAEIASVIDDALDALKTSEDPIQELARRLGISRLSKDAREYLSAVAAWWRESRPGGS